MACEACRDDMVSGRVGILLADRIHDRLLELSDEGALMAVIGARVVLAERASSQRIRHALPVTPDAVAAAGVRQHVHDGLEIANQHGGADPFDARAVFAELLPALTAGDVV